MGIEKAWGQKVKFYKRMTVWYGSRESQGLELWSGVGNKKSPCPRPVNPLSTRCPFHPAESFS